MGSDVNHSVRVIRQEGMFEELDDQQQPPFSPNHARVISERARRLRTRTRRQHAALGIVALAIAAVGAGATLVRDEGDDLTLASSDAATVSSTTTATSTTAVTEVPSTVPETMVPAAPTAASVTTTSAPEPPAPAGTCSQQEVAAEPNEQGLYDNASAQVRIELDRTVIAPGDGLIISAIATNPTDHEIHLTWASHEPVALIRDSSGHVVWHFMHIVGMGGIPEPLEVMVPSGESTVVERHWMSEACEGSGEAEPYYSTVSLAPGLYSVEITWLGVTPNPVTFEVRSHR